MTREVPTSRVTTVWKGDGRWFQRRDAAYYAVAKALVLNRYPRWLEEPDLDETVDGEVRGDTIAREHGVADWRRLRARREDLFYARMSGDYAGFDPERWQRLLKRLARFLMFVDDRRARLGLGTPIVEAT